MAVHWVQMVRQRPFRSPWSTGCGDHGGGAAGAGTVGKKSNERAVLRGADGRAGRVRQVVHAHRFARPRAMAVADAPRQVSWRRRAARWLPCAWWCRIPRTAAGGSGPQARDERSELEEKAPGEPLSVFPSSSSAWRAHPGRGEDASGKGVLPLLPPLGWPAAAVALIFLISRIIWNRAAWWRFVVGIVVLAIVTVAGLRVLGVHESALPRMAVPTVSATAVPATAHAQRPSPAAAATPVRTASPRVHPGGRGRGARRVQRGGGVASARTARPPRVRPGLSAARVRAGGRPCRRPRGCRRHWHVRPLWPYDPVIRPPDSRRIARGDGRPGRLPYEIVPPCT
jgi:hypothetical protein